MAKTRNRPKSSAKNQSGKPAAGATPGSPQRAAPATVTHHRHEAAKAPLGCAACHMPERTYMGVDRRHDHGFRVPRPDLSAKLGIPNACNDCHRDLPAEWAAAAVEGWHDPDPMVRIGALDMLEGTPPNRLWPLVSPLLSDSNRGVRIRAAALLAAVPSAGQPAADRERFERAAAEFVAAQRLNADRPEALARLKRPEEALVALGRARELDPNRARYSYVNAVALHSAGRGDEALAVLKEGLVRHPEDRDILLALISFSRDAGDLPVALEYAERLSRLFPNDREAADQVKRLRAR